MQYMLLVYENEAWRKRSKAEQLPVCRACRAWHEDLVKSGHARATVGLRPPAETTTLRERNGQLAATDGPFIETKEVLGGFELIECQDREEALTIARRFPALGAGLTLEVRAVMTDEDIERLMTD